MKQITERLAISSFVKSEYAAVLNRLSSMGFTHLSGHSHGHMMKSWEDYPVFDIQEVNGRRYARNAAPGSFDDLIPASQFLAEYGPGAAPAAPLNPANFVVDTGRNPALSRMVQELAFSTGMLWTNEDKHVTDEGSPYLYFIRGEAPFPFEIKGMMHSSGPTPTPPADQWPLYSAATQMGEIVRLFSTPVVPPAPPPVAPEIHGYKAAYSAGAPTINFGCAEISVNLLQCFLASMEKAQPGNCTVNSITLSSGKSLNQSRIAEILRYVAAVEEYAKKYPETSTPSSK